MTGTRIATASALALVATLALGRSSAEAGKVETRPSARASAKVMSAQVSDRAEQEPATMRLKAPSPLAGLANLTRSTSDFALGSRRSRVPTGTNVMVFDAKPLSQRTVHRVAERERAKIEYCFARFAATSELEPTTPSCPRRRVPGSPPCAWPASRVTRPAAADPTPRVESEREGGEVTAAFTIQPSGRVQSLRVKAAGFENRRLETCLARHIRSWRFPTANTSTEVIYPFVFDVASPTPTPSAPR